MAQTVPTVGPSAPGLVHRLFRKQTAASPPPFNTPPNTSPGTPLSLWIDLCRWVAAFLVLFQHTGLRMLQPVARTSQPGHLYYLYLFIDGFGHQAVMVFFVLSGYLVGGSALEEHRRRGQLDLPRYLFKRFIRLSIVLWPTFLWILLADRLAIGAGAIGYGVLPGNTPATLGLSGLACNMAFLQTAACLQYGNNGALWSLFNEVWYYIAWPPLMLAVAGRMSMAARVLLAGGTVALLVALTAWQFTGAAIGPYMLIWIMGVWAAAARKPILRSTPSAALLFILVLVGLRLGIRRDFAETHTMIVAGFDFLLGGLFANLLLTARHSTVLRPPPGGRLHQQLASFSFSLYCTHIPVLVLFTTALMAVFGFGWQMDAGVYGVTTWLLFGAGMGLSILFAAGFARLTEAHTDALRRRIWRW